MSKVLVVDDSALMRRQMASILEAEGYQLAFARHGQEALELNLEFQPDVITLDINMPEMDGLTALSHIMVDRPVPVIMVSSLTERGALATFEALALGAIDYVAKPDGTISLSIAQVGEELRTKVRAALVSKRRSSSGLRASAQTPAAPSRVKPRSTLGQAMPNVWDGRRMTLIGVSTGGPRSLEDVLPQLSADFPDPVVVVQHMPGSFTPTFASRLDSLCALPVVHVDHPVRLEGGTIYIAQGGADIELTRRGQDLYLVSKPEQASFAWHPSVERLARSVLQLCDPAQITAVMLTGMGSDGADAFTELKNRGAKTIAESEETAVVFGMPAELIARGGAGVILPLPRIAEQIMRFVR